MKKILTCLLLLQIMVFQRANAQKQTNLQEIDRYKWLEFKDVPLTVPSPNFYVADIIDTRPDTVGIGIVQTGAFNRKAIGAFVGGLPKSLQTYLNKNLPKKENAQPLLLNIVKLQVSEHTYTMSEEAKFHSFFEVYAIKDGKYVKVLDKKVVYEVTKGADVTNKHEKHIREAVDVLFNEIVKQKKLDSLTINPVSLETILAERFIDYPVLNTPVKKGFYTSIENFVNNQPNITATKFHLKERKQQGITFYKLKLDSEIKENEDAMYSTKSTSIIEDLRFISDGVKSYAKIDDKFFLITKDKDNNLTFLGYDATLIISSGASQGAIIGGLAGGLLGAAIGSAAGRGNENGWRLYKIDLQTGQFVPTKAIQK
jgi:hypothetical protein